MKWLRYGVIGLAILVLLAAAGFFATLHLMDSEKLRQLVVEQLSAATSRDITIDGEVTPEFSFNPTLSAAGLKVGNAPWASKKPMLRADTLSVGLDALALLRGNVTINSIRLENATLRLERKGSRQNWEFESNSSDEALENAPNEQPSPAETGQTSSNFSVGQIDLINTRILYLESGKIKQDVTFNRFSGTNLRGEALESFSLAAAYRGLTLEGSGSMRDGMLLFDLDGKATDVAASVKGSISVRESVFDAAVTLDAARLNALLALLEVASEDATPVQLAGQLGGNTDLVTIDELEGQYGSLDMTGKLSLALKEVPKFDGAIRVAAINLADFSDKKAQDTNPATDAAATTETAEPTNNDAKETHPSSIPELVWPIELFGTATGTLNIKIDSLIAAPFELENLQSSVSLTPTALQIAEVKAESSAGGTVSGAASLSKGETLPVLKLELNVDDASLETFLLATDADIGLTGGATKAHLTLEGAGNSLKESLSASNGEVYLYVDRAEMPEPKTLEQAKAFFELMSGNARDDIIRYECAIADFEVTSGVAKSRSLAVRSANAVIVGEGRVRMKSETLRIGLKARSSAIGMADILPPLVIAGPWRDPSVTLDAKTNLLNIGKFALGAVTGVGLVAVVGEQLTDKLGISEQNMPCLESMEQANQQIERSETDPKATYKETEDRVRKVREEVKDNLEDSAKEIEDDVKVIRDGLKGIFNKP